MIKKAWVHKAKSFKEAQEFDQQYTARMTFEERISAMEFLRRCYYKLNQGGGRACSRRLRRVVKVLQQE